LTAQNDVINSREQIIKTEYDKLFAKYRILDVTKINLDIDDDKIIDDLDLCDASLP